MSKFSSKYANLLAFDNISSIFQINNKPSDGILILTSMGYITGKLHIPSVPEDNKTNSNLSDSILLSKDILINKFEEFSEEKDSLELTGDGSAIELTNARIFQNNRNVLTLDKLFLHCENIIGFAPINLENFNSQIK